MDDDRRDLIDHFGSELAGILEDASVAAATLRGVPRKALVAEVYALTLTCAKAHALAEAMSALLQQDCRSAS